MGKIAFLFSGQGDQAPGMGASLAQASPAAQAVFDLADALRPGTSAQCFSGSAEELADTLNTQPCVYAVDLAAGRALTEAGVFPDMAAGFSLGEVAALTFAGAFSDEDGFRFVCLRAAAMREAAEETPGAMAAVLGLSVETAEALCGEFPHVWSVNYNCPGQVVVACQKEDLEPFCQRVQAAGGKAVPLAVSGGFHSPLMAPAANKLRNLLEGIPLATPGIPVYANATAAPYPEDQRARRALLARQVNSPVRWQETLEALAAQGADTFVTCGPGKTLSGLARKTLKGATVLRVEDAETLAKAVGALRER